MQRWLIGFAIGLLTLTLAGRPATLAAEERVVHFFQINALTGQAGSYGTRSIHGVELAAKHMNDAGGFTDTCGNKYTIKLSAWDMANSREQAIAGLRKAAELEKTKGASCCKKSPFGSRGQPPGPPTCASRVTSTKRRPPRSSHSLWNKRLPPTAVMNRSGQPSLS